MEFQTRKTRIPTMLLITDNPIETFCTQSKLLHSFSCKLPPAYHNETTACFTLQTHLFFICLLLFFPPCLMYNKITYRFPLAYNNFFLLLCSHCCHDCDQLFERRKRASPLYIFARLSFTHRITPEMERTVKRRMAGPWASSPSFACTLLMSLGAQSSLWPRLPLSPEQYQ